jgi:predicted glycosyltransferase
VLTRPRIFLYVQHLLGIGHLRRAVTLARACVAAGLEVTLASGGRGVPGSIPAGVRWVQLPPVSATDASFKHLVDADGVPIDEPWKERRRDALLEAWRAADCQALVLELFPFGRRPMRFELLPLLEAASSAKPRPLIVSSVRDVLAGGSRRPEREAEALALLERYFDHVLVHGDPGLIDFGHSFEPAARIKSKLHYTGYVVEPASARGAPDPARTGEVLVSAGGGAVGQGLLETAIRARPRSALAECRWRVLAGVNAGARGFAELEALAAGIGDGKIVVERAREDFRLLLSACAVSVSQAGYNTVAEALQAGARAVVVPFSGGGETEQGLRARLLAERGLIEMVEEDALTPQTLAAAIDRVAGRPRPEAAIVDLGGAPHSAALLAGWMRSRAE